MTAPATLTTPTDLDQARGLMVNVLRTAGRDCSNNGISSRADRLTIVGTFDPDTGRIGLMPTDSRVFPPADAAPAVLLTWAPEDRRRAGIGHQPRLIDPAHLVPVDADAGIYRLPLLWDGGAFAHGYDSRYTELLGQVPDLAWPDAPIAIHDRY